MNRKTSNALAQAAQLPDPHALVESIEDNRADQMHQFQDALQVVWDETLLLPPEQGEAVRQSINQMWDRLKASNGMMDRMG